MKISKWKAGVRILRILGKVSRGEMDTGTADGKVCAILTELDTAEDGLDWLEETVDGNTCSGSSDYLRGFHNMRRFAVEKIRSLKTPRESITLCESGQPIKVTCGYIRNAKSQSTFTANEVLGKIDEEVSKIFPSCITNETGRAQYGAELTKARVQRIIRLLRKQEAEKKETL